MNIYVKKLFQNNIKIPMRFDLLQCFLGKVFGPVSGVACHHVTVNLKVVWLDFPVHIRLELFSDSD